MGRQTIIHLISYLNGLIRPAIRPESALTETTEKLTEKRYRELSGSLSEFSSAALIVFPAVFPLQGAPGCAPPQGRARES